MTNTTPDFSDRTNREVPSQELREADADFLSRTGIPYAYRAAVYDAENCRQLDTGTRPSNAKMNLRYHLGRRDGIVTTVQALFGYDYHDDAAKVLDMSIERLPAVEAEREAAANAVAQTDRAGHYSDTRPTEFRITRPESLPLVFDGWEIGHIDSRDQMGEAARETRDRWADVFIYRTTSDKWVVAQIGRTREKGQRDRAVVRICNTPQDVVNALRHREGYLTKVAVGALEQAIAADPDLDEAKEERI